MEETKRIIMPLSHGCQKKARALVGNKPGFNIVWQMALDFLLAQYLSGKDYLSENKLLLDLHSEFIDENLYYFDKFIGYKLVESKIEKDIVTFTLSNSAQQQSKIIPDLGQVIDFNRVESVKGWLPGVIALRPKHCPFIRVLATKHPEAEYIQESRYISGNHHKSKLFQYVCNQAEDRRLDAFFLQTKDDDSANHLKFDMERYVKENRALLEVGEKKVFHYLPSKEMSEKLQRQPKKPSSGIVVKGKNYHNVVKYHRETKLPFPQIYRRLNSKHPEWVDWYFVGSSKDPSLRG